MKRFCPTSEEREVIKKAEELMRDAMNLYDPSHDVYHGQVVFNYTSNMNSHLLIEQSNE
jgi:hypothetical protein